MSIQTNSYTSRKTGKTKTQYYANVWDKENKKSIIGPMRATKTEAKQDEAAILLSLAGEDIQPEKKKRSRKSGMTVEEVASIWKDASKPPVYSNNTYEGYVYYYDHYLSEVFGEQPVSSVKPIHIQKFVNIFKEKYGPETTNKNITVLKNIFEFALVTLQEIKSNPVTGIKRVKVPRHTHTTWDDETIQYFLSLPTVMESNYYELFCVSFLLGPRPSEVCGLKEDSLLSNPPRLRYYKGYDRYGAESDMKTDGSHRTIWIPENLYRLLRRKYLQKKELQLSDPTFAKNDFLFVTSKGNPIKPDLYSKAFKRIVNAHNKSLEKKLACGQNLEGNERILPDITLYNCRHSFATNSLETHYDPALISSIMGNSPKTLLTFYAQPKGEMQLNLLEKNTDEVLKNTVRNIS